MPKRKNQRKIDAATAAASSPNRQCHGPRKPQWTPSELDGEYWKPTDERRVSLTKVTDAAAADDTETDCPACLTSVNHSPGSSPQKSQKKDSERGSHDANVKEIETKWRAVCEVMCARVTAKVKRERVTVAAMHRIASRYSMSDKSLYRIAQKAMSGRTLARKVPVKGSKFRRPVIQHWLLAKCKEWKGIFTIWQMTAAFRAHWGFGSVGGIHGTLTAMGWVLKHRHYLPLLEQRHKEARLQWVRQLLARVPRWGSDEEVLIHVDEKWFFAQRLHQPVWVPPRTAVPMFSVVHRDHIPKEMFLGAVALPIRRHNFDGMIGLYPVVKKIVAKRKSKNHDVGDEYDIADTMTADKFIEMLEEKVIPDALRKTGTWVRRVVVQFDNAGGHGGGRGDVNLTTIRKLQAWVRKLPQRLRRMCRGNPHGLPAIEFVAQPARSPDLNVLDLGAWWSLQVTVDRLKEENGGATVSEQVLRDRVLEAWDLWQGAEKLDKLFNTLWNVLSKIEEVNGGNNYLLPHS